MTEPFLYLISGELEPPFYSEKAPVIFKNPSEVLSLVPVTSRILSLDRDFYTRSEIEDDKQILKMSKENTLKNRVRMNTDNDFISIRSDKTEMPCAAAFMLGNREKLFQALKIDIDRHYVIFITADEVMFADKTKFRPTQIKKVTANIKNKMASLFPDNSPILRTEVFEYDRQSGSYKEV